VWSDEAKCNARAAPHRSMTNRQLGKIDPRREYRKSARNLLGANDETSVCQQRKDPRRASGRQLSLTRATNATFVETSRASSRRKWMWGDRLPLIVDPMQRQRSRKARAIAGTWRVKRGPFTHGNCTGSSVLHAEDACCPSLHRADGVFCRGKRFRMVRNGSMS
jgi:hypothetical protein